MKKYTVEDSEAYLADILKKLEEKDFSSLPFSIENSYLSFSHPYWLDDRRKFKTLTLIEIIKNNKNLKIVSLAAIMLACKEDSDNKTAVEHMSIIEPLLSKNDKIFKLRFNQFGAAPGGETSSIENVSLSQIALLALQSMSSHSFYTIEEYKKWRDKNEKLFYRIKK